MDELEWIEGHTFEGKNIWLNEAEMAQYFCVKRDDIGKPVRFGVICRNYLSGFWDWSVQDINQRTIGSGQQETLLEAKRVSISDLLKNI